MRIRVKIILIVLFLLMVVHSNAQLKYDKYSFDSIISNYSPEIVFKYLALNNSFKKNIGIDSVIKNYQKCFEEFTKDTDNKNLVKKSIDFYRNSISKKSRLEIERLEKFCYLNKVVSIMPIYVKDNNEDILPFSLFDNIKGIDKIIYNKLGSRPYSSMASCEGFELYNDILIYISSQKRKKYIEIISLIFKNYSKLVTD